MTWSIALLILAAGKAPTLSPEALARYSDAVAKVQAGQHGPATEVLNGLAAEYPRVAEVFASRCSAQLGLRHFPAAEADCAYALAVRPNLPAAVYGLATAEELQGKTEAAIGHYRAYVALEDPQATYKPQASARLRELEGGSALPVPPPPPMVGPGAQPTAPTGQLGTLLVYRNHMIASNSRGRAQQVSLVLDGKPVGDIAHDQFVEIQVGTGNHLLEARFAVDNIFEVGRVLSVSIDLNASVPSYVNFDTVGGQLMLRNVPTEQGRKEIKDDCTKAFTRKM